MLDDLTLVRKGTEKAISAVKGDVTHILQYTSKHKHMNKKSSSVSHPFFPTNARLFCGKNKWPTALDAPAAPPRNPPPGKENSRQVLPPA